MAAPGYGPDMLIIMDWGNFARKSSSQRLTYFLPEAWGYENSG